MSNKMLPIMAGLVGVVSGVYIFQPVVLQQLKLDGNLKPEYNDDEKLTQERLGTLTSDPKDFEVKK